MRKKRKLRKPAIRAISVILAVAMVFTTAPVFAANGVKAAPDKDLVISAQEDVSAQEVREAVEKFTDSLSKFVADTSQMSKLSSLLTRFGGVLSLAGGAMGILEMTGIIKDPTEAMLSQIMGEIRSVQDQLNVIDKKIDQLNLQLIDIAAYQQEEARNSKATNMLKYWRDFTRDYCEPMDDLINQYQSKINAGIRVWWENKGPKDGILVLYSMQKKDGVTAPALTYSLASYKDGVPANADNGEAVTADYSFGVPAEIIPDTSSIRFNITNYRRDFETRMAQAFITAADAHKLTANDEFYKTWDGLSDADKTAKAGIYAADILNSQIYRISCDTMSNNDGWVVEVTNAYRKYCDNIMKQDSGVHAMLNAIYLTHGFEGEAKKDIRNFCSGMVVQAGLYGQFALTCACQDDMQSIENRQKVQNQMVNTVKSLSDKEKCALTGNDNYCYITGTLMSHEYIHATSNVEVHINGDAYKGFYASNWSLTVPNILNDVYAKVLYNQYKAQNQGKSSFAAYLHAYGAYPWDNADGAYIMTKYGGNQTFPLTEGIRMRADNYFAGEKYFKSWEYYNINMGNSSSVESEYFHLHDKVVCNLLDLKTGNIEVDQTAAARALYGESHWYWSTDEAWMFFTDRNSNSRFGNILTGSWPRRDGSDYYVNKKFDLGLHVLKLEPCHNLNADKDPEDPFLAYGHPSLTTGMSDVMGPIYEDKTKDLTQVELESTSYTYTGKEIRPKVSVKAGKKTVPSKGHTVTYRDNQEPGYATVTVTGKGDYSDTISVQFKILPKKTSIKTVKRSKTSANVRWKKQFTEHPTEGVNGYQIRYSTKASMKNAKTADIFDHERTSAKITGLKKNKKYYFQIRTFMEDQNTKEILYSKWSKKRIVK